MSNFFFSSFRIISFINHFVQSSLMFVKQFGFAAFPPPGANNSVGLDGIQKSVFH